MANISMCPIGTMICAISFEKSLLRTCQIVVYGIFGKNANKFLLCAIGSNHQMQIYSY